MFFNSLSSTIFLLKHTYCVQCRSLGTLSLVYLCFILLNKELKQLVE